MSKLFWDTSLGLIEHKPDIQNSQYKIEIEVKLELNSLDEIISKWETDNQDSWADIGFKLRGNQSTKWLSHADVKGEFTTENLIWNKDHTVVEIDSLNDFIETHRDQLMLLLSEEN